MSRNDTGLEGRTDPDVGRKRRISETDHDDFRSRKLGIRDTMLRKATSGKVSNGMGHEMGG